MKTFNLNCTVTISMYTKVEAETLEEAIQIASKKDVMPIIHDGSCDENEMWMCDDIDGSPSNIYAE